MGIVIGQLGISTGTYDDIFLHETANRTIYVTTTGSDATGDGSSGSPYLTISKALSAVKKIIDGDVAITIDIGAGSFSMDADDFTMIASISGPGQLIIQGALTLSDSGFTMGAADALDPLKYSVSGGNTASWTLNQWKYYLLKSGTNYYPITHNALTPTISIAGNVTGTEIYQLSTVITISASANINVVVNCYSLWMQNLKIILPAYNFEISSSYNQYLFRRVNFQASLNTVFFTLRYGLVQYCSFNDVRVLASEGFAGTTYSYYYLNSNYNCMQLNSDRTVTNVNNNVFENPSTGSAACGLYLVNGKIIDNGLTLRYLKFINCNVGIKYSEPYTLKYGVTNQKIILSTCNYFLRKNSTSTDYETGYFIFTFSNFYGAPVTRWFYDSIYEFVNELSGRIIQISGLLYPESDVNLKTTLLDAQTTNIVVGNKLQNRAIFIDYLVQRGSDYEQGRLKIVHNGTNITLQQDVPLNPDLSTPITTAGVTFAVAFSGNDIQLRCTLTNLTPSVNAILNYNAQRVMITPLTI